MSDLDRSASHIADLAKAAKDAASLLDLALFNNCRGPHLYRQHRDHKPPWCNACGYTAAGERIKDQP